MVGIVIATHGPFAQALSESVGLIMGHNDSVKCIGLYHGDDIDTFMQNVETMIQEADDGSGVLVFTDMYGGSPSNATALSMNHLKGSVEVECLLGVNLPMVLEALSMRSSMNLEALSIYIKESGRSSIELLSRKLLGD